MLDENIVKEKWSKGSCLIFGVLIKLVFSDVGKTSYNMLMVFLSYSDSTITLMYL